MCVRNVKYWRDVVTGEAGCSGQTLCETERKSWLPKLRGYCGKEGRFFELNENCPSVGATDKANDNP